MLDCAVVAENNSPSTPTRTRSQVKNEYKQRRRAARAKEREETRSQKKAARDEFYRAHFRKVAALVVIQWHVSWIRYANPTPVTTAVKRRQSRHLVQTLLATTSHRRGVITDWAKVGGFYIYAIQGVLDGRPVTTSTIVREFSCVETTRDGNPNSCRVVTTQSGSVYKLRGPMQGCTGESVSILEDKAAAWSAYMFTDGPRPTMSLLLENDAAVCRDATRQCPATERDDPFAAATHVRAHLRSLSSVC